MHNIRLELIQKGNDWRGEISIPDYCRFDIAHKPSEPSLILEEIRRWLKEKKGFASLIEKLPELAEELKILNHAVCGREVQCSGFNMLKLAIFQRLSFSFVIKNCPALILPGANIVSFPELQKRVEA